MYGDFVKQPSKLVNDELAIGLDIGGTTIKAGLVRGDCIVGQMIERPTPQELGPFVTEVEAIVNELKEMSDNRMIEIGIGVPGLVSRLKKQIVRCPNIPFLNGVGFGELFNQFVPTFGNDSDVALLGEVIVNHMEMEDALLITIGTGLGSAFYIGGVGSWDCNLAAEAGHMKMVPNGRACTCGGKGCLEAYFSGHALLELAREHIWAETKSAEEVFKWAREGSEDAQKLINKGAAMLGIAIANLINIFGIEKIILTGKLSLSSDFFMHSLRQAVEENLFIPDSRVFSITQSGLIDRSAIIGAATLALRSKAVM